LTYECGNAKVAAAETTKTIQVIIIIGRRRELSACRLSLITFKFIFRENQYSN
jgi:hypothetical protein